MVWESSRKLTRPTMKINRSISRGSLFIPLPIRGNSRPSDGSLRHGHLSPLCRKYNRAVSSGLCREETSHPRSCSPQVVHAFLLFPTIERMAESPNGKIATPLLCWFRYALYAISYLLLKPCPDVVKSWLAGLILQVVDIKTEFPLTSMLQPSCLGKCILKECIYYRIWKCLQSNLTQQMNSTHAIVC